MNIINDIIISLLALSIVRFFAFLVFLELLIREKKLKYLMLTLGWLVYAFGSCSAIISYNINSNINNPVFGILVTIGTFFIIMGFLLYFFDHSPKTITIQFTLLCFTLIAFLILTKNINSYLTVGVQLFLLLMVSHIVLFKRKWILKKSSITSYIWISSFLCISISTTVFHLTFDQTSISIRFIMTLITNLFLLITFWQFDREQTLKKLKESKIKIAASLKEKEMLLKEVHHRVKNNMAIMNSLLSLQSSNTDDPNNQEFISKAQNRIKAMAIVHETLYSTNDFSKIAFKKYINSFTSYMMKTTNDVFQIEKKIDDFIINPDKMIACGLIVNEILANSFKFIKSKSSKKTIYIESIIDKNDTVTIKIKDNGIGLPENFDPFKSKGIGFKLITNLIKELDGKLNIENDNGLVVGFSFKVDQKV